MAHGVASERLRGGKRRPGAVSTGGLAAADGQDAVNQDAKTPQSSPGKQPASFRISELLSGSVRKHLTRSDKGKIGPAAPIRGRGGVTLESHGRHFGPR